MRSITAAALTVSFLTGVVLFWNNGQLPAYADTNHIAKVN